MLAVFLIRWIVSSGIECAKKAPSLYRDPAATISRAWTSACADATLRMRVEFMNPFGELLLCLSGLP
jgi:hypothetical protein